MRPFTFPLRSVLLVATLAASAFAWAQPFGYGINSRGDFTDDSLVFALWRIDLATGDETYIGWTGRGEYIDIEGLAFSPDNRLYGADDSTHTLLRIGTETGNAAPVGGNRSNMGIPTGTAMDFGLTFTCQGKLLVSSAGSQELFSADLETGRLELIGSLGLPIVDMATIGDRVYGIGLGTDRHGTTITPNLYLIDHEVPSATLIGALGPGASPYNQAGLAADDEGNLWAITDRNRVSETGPVLASEILKLDPETGRADKIAETVVGIESLAIGPPASCGARDGHETPPEPVPALGNPALWLLILLLAGLALVRLRGDTLTND